MLSLLLPFNEGSFRQSNGDLLRSRSSSGSLFKDALWPAILCAGDNGSGPASAPCSGDSPEAEGSGQLTRLWACGFVGFPESGFGGLACGLFGRTRRTLVGELGLRGGLGGLAFSLSNSLPVATSQTLTVESGFGDTATVVGGVGGADAGALGGVSFGLRDARQACGEPKSSVKEIGMQLLSLLSGCSLGFFRVTALVELKQQQHQSTHITAIYPTKHMY